MVCHVSVLQKNIDFPGRRLKGKSFLHTAMHYGGLSYNQDTLKYAKVFIPNKNPQNLK